MKDQAVDKIIETQKQPFRCAVFSGGGAKGAIYSGAHEVLSKNGIIKELDVVAGSSAGSITSVMIATGVSSEKFKKVNQATDFSKLVGEGRFTKDGKPLLELIRSTVRSNISDHLEDINIIAVCNSRLEEINHQKTQLSILPAAEQQEWFDKLSKQEETLNSIIASGGAQVEDIRQRALDQNGKIYFKDLNILRALDPENFKDLVVTAVGKDDGELVYFGNENTPDVEIALACRASCSIPSFFEPVTINGKQYVDGGYRDNVPLYFNQKKEIPFENLSGAPEKVKEAQKSGKTLALVFGGNDMNSNANIAIYSSKKKIIDPGKLIKFLVNVVFKVLSGVGGNFQYFDEENRTYENVRENALNTVVLDTGDVSTLSFDLARERAEYLHLKGAAQTARHLDNHNIVPIQNRERFEIIDVMLTVYQESQEKTITQSWKNKIIGGKAEKSKALLNFCKEETWQSKNKTELLSDFVKEAATTRPIGNLSASTTTMQALIKTLNNPSTPVVVKQNFVELLGVDINKDQRFNKSKSLNNNLLKFNFNENDFKGFLKQKQAEKHKPTKKESSKSMAERIKKERSEAAGVNKHR